MSDSVNGGDTLSRMHRIKSIVTDTTLPYILIRPFHAHAREVWDNSEKQWVPIIEPWHQDLNQYTVTMEEIHELVSEIPIHWCRINPEGEFADHMGRSYYRLAVQDWSEHKPMPYLPRYNAKTDTKKTWYLVVHDTEGEWAILNEHEGGGHYHGTRYELMEYLLSHPKRKELEEMGLFLDGR